MLSPPAWRCVSRWLTLDSTFRCHSTRSRQFCSKMPFIYKMRRTEHTFLKTLHLLRKAKMNPWKVVYLSKEYLLYDLPCLVGAGYVIRPGGRGERQGNLLRPRYGGFLPKGILQFLGKRMEIYDWESMEQPGNVQQFKTMIQCYYINWEMYVLSVFLFFYLAAFLTK